MKKIKITAEKLNKIRQKLINDIQDELNTEQSASAIITNCGLTIHWDDGELQWFPTPVNEPNSVNQFSIPLPKDEWTIPTEKLIKLAMYEIEHAVDEYLYMLTDEDEGIIKLITKFHEFGKKGGEKTAKKYGIKHFSEAGKKGAQTRWKKNK